jgi:thioredoxin 1
MGTQKVTKANFDAEVVRADKPVLIDFWAPWCGPCKMLGPVIEEVADEVASRAKVCKVNIDEEPELAEAYGVMSIPTLIVMKDGKVTKSSVGFRPKDAILSLIA